MDENPSARITDCARMMNPSVIYPASGSARGAGPFGYRIAEQFGLKIVPPHPALVPLSFGPETLARSLSQPLFSFSVGAGGQALAQAATPASRMAGIASQAYD